MIQLGLRRAAQLFRNNPQPWKAVHVAGTNGKGTVCAYISAVLSAVGVRCGRFTSPHLIDRWDCISINEKPVAESLFREVEAAVLERNRSEDVQATEFELLTATAFDIFTRENVDIGVVEVGMGGRDDATNILKSKAVTVITKIGLDHQAFLGDTTAEIARHKCGIFKEGVPVIYNQTNEQSVIDVIKEEAAKVGAGPLIRRGALPPSKNRKWQAFAKQLRSRKQQRIGISTAFEVVKLLKPLLPGIQWDHRVILKTIIGLNIPGRMQNLNIQPLIGVDKTVLVDGAHNAQAAQNLGYTLPIELRPDRFGPITWVVAYTKGKEVQEILGYLLEKPDKVAVVEFGPVDGMPWISATPSEEIVDTVRQMQSDMPVQGFGRNLEEALKWAAEKAGEGPIVVTGSLYLVSDLLRLMRDKQGTGIEE